MFLTTCAVCAKALDDDEVEAPRRCEPCGTRYCSEECEREGRDHDCDAIVRAGGAEAAYVSRKSADAVAEAVASCAEETAGKTCYICLEVEDDEGHACVRGCACRGEAGFAHLSCLARNAQATVDRIPPSHVAIIKTMFDVELLMGIMRNWGTCGLCHQDFTENVRLALGFACWNNNSARDESDSFRLMALAVLGRGLLGKSGCEQEAVAIQEAIVAKVRAQWPENRNEILQMNANLAAAYEDAGRKDQGIAIKRECYLDAKAMTGPRSELTLVCANNLAVALINRGSLTEAKTLLKAQLAYQADAELDNELSIHLLTNYAKALYKNSEAVPDDLLESIATYEKCLTAARRLWGAGHPQVTGIERHLGKAREALAAPKSARFERALKRARKD